MSGILDVASQKLPRFDEPFLKRVGPVWHVGSAGSQTLAVDEPRRTVRAIISTSNPDRVGDIVLTRGLRNAQEYLRNPVVLWAHQRSLPPVGTCTRLDVLDDRIVAETQFVEGHPLAEEVFRLCARGILKGWSIGFLPIKARLQSSSRGTQSLLIEEWDLVEYSVVPVPENAEALTAQKSIDILDRLVGGS